MKSMTGFAQGRFNFDKFSVSIKLKSVNHRFLDVSFKGTGVTPASEKLMRDIVKGRLNRGKVEITFDLFELDPKRWDIQFNETLLNEILSRLLTFKKKMGDDFSISLDPLLKIPMIFHLDYVFDKFTKTDTRRIQSSFRKVFNEFIQSRIVEGQAIYNDILDSVEAIDANLIVLESQAQKLEKVIFKRYKERISRFVQGTEIEERRLLQEAAVAAEKACITEEINRLRTHNKRLRALLNNKKVDVKGREADFLSQEMHRETYTIAAKTTSMDVHERVIQVRREIEKIRQQVQNVE